MSRELIYGKRCETRELMMELNFHRELRVFPSNPIFLKKLPSLKLHRGFILSNFLSKKSREFTPHPSPESNSRDVFEKISKSEDEKIAKSFWGTFGLWNFSQTPQTLTIWYLCYGVESGSEILIFGISIKNWVESCNKIKKLGFWGNFSIFLIYKRRPGVGIRLLFAGFTQRSPKVYFKKLFVTNFNDFYM
jgi:hypothetical protein